MRAIVRNLMVGLILFLAGAITALAQAPTITGISPSSGAVGTSVTITGTNFGSTQATSAVSLNGVAAVATSWSNSSVVAVVPTGATSGLFSVVVNSQTANSSSFSVSAIPSRWTDADIGSVGVAGSALYANGTFTVKGSGADIFGNSDAFHFAYQSLSGDGSIIARVVSLQGGGTYCKAGVMIRETLAASSTNADIEMQPQNPTFTYRTGTGGSTSYASGTGTAPFWVKLVRSGNSFTGYASQNGVDWSQVGSSQTIAMAQNVYIGLAVTANNNSLLATGTFDSVFINSTAAAAPVVTAVSATTGGAGTQVSISGSNFGASQGSSAVMLNGAPVLIASWSNTAIFTTIPTGATSGPLLVAVGPSMNEAYATYFNVTSQPLPVGWLDHDIGPVGQTGTATYANGTFTVKGSGADIYGNSDGFHFAYQSLSGDGSIIARVVSLQGGGTWCKAGVMIRETLAANSTNTYTQVQPQNPNFFYRTTTGGSTSYTAGTGTPPYWVKLVRSGNSFTGYTSPDGVIWSQLGTSQTITMAQNVYVGLAVSANNNSLLTTATFDSVSINSAAAPAPVVTAVSATTGAIGTQIGISGSNFGASRGISTVTLNGAPVTINSWSSSAILITIPAGATSGPLLVEVGPSMNEANATYFTVTSYPLPVEWLDQNVGSGTGSATYSNGIFTVTGIGWLWNGGGSDSFHLAYQPMVGDGSIVARVLNVTNGPWISGGVMIRESLAPTSTYAMTAIGQGSTAAFVFRTTTGASSGYSSMSAPSTPCWVKLVRSGSTFSAYQSADGANWTQVGASQTISMAQNVYVGLAVGSGSTTSSATATFDNVSITSNADPAPIITSLSATSGSIGSQVSINGSNFGASQGNGAVMLHGAPLTINLWSSTLIVATIPTGATSGPLMVSVGQDINNSNYVIFTVTSQPLPIGWLDIDVGDAAIGGSASYANGTFTVNGIGLLWNAGTSDQFHLVYQPMVGDGSIVARVVNNISGYFVSAGIIIRESLAPTSTFASTMFSQGSTALFVYRTATGASSGYASASSSGPPGWIKLVRNGSTFSGYQSADGVNWTQVGTSQTINMAQNVYVGLAMDSGTSTTASTGKFDNVSISFGTTPYISGLSPSLGSAGTSVTIAGSNFGATQGTSTITFNGVAATVTSWSSSQIVAVVPSAVPTGTGPVSITVNSTPSVPLTTFTAINPVITSLAPPAAPIGGQVIVNGSGFGSASSGSQVLFNGVAATATAWSDSSITVTVPANATSGSVSVNEAGFPSNSASFTVIESLSVSGATPAIGPVGTTVTITGAGFGATQSNSVASFDGAPANIVSWSDTSIVATVPAAASTGYLTVSVAGELAQGPLFVLTNSATLTDSLGHTTTYNSQVIGGQWRVTDSQGSGCSSCTQRGTIHDTYDASGNLLTRTDELGHTTTYTYDGNGNVLSISQPDGNGNTATTTYTYNGFNEVLTVTDPLGNVTTNAYDSHGNLTSVTSPKPNSTTAASVTQFAYDSKGQLIQITDPLNNITSLTYTPVGLIATIKDAQNNVTTYGYDTHGNRTSVTDALSHQTTFGYDTGDRLTTITYPDANSTTTTFTYDHRGRRTSVTDQNAKITTYTYDDADRLTSVKDAANNTTTYGYDTEDNLTTITDAKGHSTAFTYDAFGRVTNTNFPSTLSETYAYDAIGNLLSKTDRKGQTIQYVYDALNRLTKKQYPNSTEVDYVYDLVGKIQSVNDPTGTYAFAYDNMGRLIGTTTSYSFLTARNFTTGYSYDAGSNRTGFTDPESGSTTYVYDTLNRLQTLTPPSAFTATGSFGFGYDALSRRTQMTRPNNVVTNYGYDNLSRLQSVLHQLAGSTIDGATYTVDNAGNRTAKTDQRAGVTSNYAYDAIYELTGVTQGTNTTESYTYDPVGNRLSSLGASPYNVNVSNQLTSTPSTNYTYDSNGNTLTKTDSTGTTSYTWDFENRLTGVTLPGTGGTVNFKYDPFGRRIYKSFSAGTPSVYAFDGDNLVEETNSSGVAIARYSQTQNIDEPLAMLRSGATSYYHADGLGSITALSNSAGSLAQTYSYDSFGRPSSTGSLTNPFQYTARELDTETSLYYYRARYYDPQAGRFLGEDPIGFGGGSNFYNYSSADPMNFSDPTGLLSVCSRPVRFFQWMGALGLCHGFLKLSDGTTIGGYNRNGKLVPNKDDRDDKSDPNHLKETRCIELPESKCPISNDDRVRQAYDDLKNQFDQYREATGHYPNYATGSGVSTGVAQTILDNAGVRYRFPARCFGWMSGTVPPIPGPTGGGGGAPW